MIGRIVQAFRELTPVQAAGQFAVYLLLFAFVGYLADQPSYRYLEEGQAEIKLAVRHTGQLLGECRELGAEEMSRLAPNMRAPLVCPRERSPVRVELALDEKVMYLNSIAPAGLHNDGISAAYATFMVPEGPVTLRLSIDDDANSAGFTHELQRDIVLRAGQSFVIEFSNGFNLHAPDPR